MNKKKLLLIGKTGFVSSKLQKILKEKKIKFQAIGSKDVDLTNIKSAKQLDRFDRNDTQYIVYFFSALTPDKGKDEFTLIKNVQMISNFFKYFPRNKISYFVYISSDAVYGSEEKINNFTNAFPADLYGYMHLLREKIVLSHIESSKICILRPTAIYGKGDTHNSYGPNRFFKSARESSKISLFGKGLDKRDHLFIEDFCNVLLKLLKKQISGIYPIACEKSYTFTNVAMIIKKYFKLKKNKDIKIEFIPNNSQPSKKYFNSLKYKKLLNIKNSNLEKSILMYFKK